MKVIAHPLPEVFGHARAALGDIRAITHDKSHSHEWISTTTTLYNPNDGLVYVGLTHHEGDLLYSYEPGTGRATCCNYLKIRIKNEVKIHRYLVLGPDGRIYGATAGLIDFKTRNESPGGQIWAYDPKTGEYEVFGIPVPHDYVQHVVFDFERHMAYGATYPAPWFFAFDMKTRRTKRASFINALPHHSAIDDRGRAWTCYANVMSSEHFLLSYDPETNEITWRDLQLPRVALEDRRQIDAAVNLGDGYLYFGSENGGFSRLDPEKGVFQWLGKPARGWRLSAIAEGPDGLVYLATGAYYSMTGDDATTRVFSYDREAKHFTELGPIYDPDFGDGCAVVHYITVDDDGTLWIGETDNNQRSGCLWECRVT